MHQAIFTCNIRLNRVNLLNVYQLCQDMLWVIFQFEKVIYQIRLVRHMKKNVLLVRLPYFWNVCTKM